MLDSTLVGLVYHRYIADLIARAPARSALEPQALPVSFFLAKKPTTRYTTLLRRTVRGAACLWLLVVFVVGGKCATPVCCGGALRVTVEWGVGRSARWDATPMPGVLVVNIEEQPARQGSFQRSPSSAEVRAPPPPSLPSIDTAPPSLGASLWMYSG